MNSAIGRGALAALAAAVLLVAGCGGSGSPEDAVSDLYAAAGDGDAAKLCELLTDEAAQQAADDEDAETCEEGTAKALSGGAGGLLAGIEVGDSEIDGDSAKVAISFGGNEDTVSVVKQDGEWKVEQD